MRGKASSENESTSAAVAEGKESSDFCRNPPPASMHFPPKKVFFSEGGWFSVSFGSSIRLNGVGCCRLGKKG